MESVQNRRRFSLSISIPRRRSSILVPPQQLAATPSTPSRFSRVIRRLSTSFRGFPAAGSSTEYTFPRYDSFIATDYMYDDDIDVSYEGLLRLAARIGDAKPKNLPQDLKAALPRGVYKDCSQAQVEKRCPICLDQYNNSDMVLGIPECSHYFHAMCFEKWLDLAANCPVCRCEITPSSTSATSVSSHSPSTLGFDPTPTISPILHSIARTTRDYDLPYNHIG